MNTTQATTALRFSVVIDGGSIKVTAADKTEAAELGIARMVEIAKNYNAKYESQFATAGVRWTAKSENAADYSVTTIRKLASR